MLQQSNHDLEVRNLLSWPWTPNSLKLFLADEPVSAWFNQSSPRIKSGEVVPTQLTEEQAILELIADPILIRRPLLQVGEERKIGFDQAKIESWIGLKTQNETVTEGCPKTS